MQTHRHSLIYFKTKLLESSLQNKPVKFQQDQYTISRIIQDYNIITIKQAQLNIQFFFKCY